jgi:TFIIF-interacting CTD phosphatase-like protein
MSLFAPDTGKERRALMKHLDSKTNKQAIADRINDPAYQKEIVRLRDYHQWLFSGIRFDPSKNIAQPRPGEEKAECGWARSGLSAEVTRVAEQYSVPYYTVCGHTNSYTTWPCAYPV